MGAWARVTIDRLRQLALSTLKKHRAPTNVFSNQIWKYTPPSRARTGRRRRGRRRARSRGLAAPVGSARDEAQLSTLIAIR
jgi:hypothetical protein